MTGTAVAATLPAPATTTQVDGSTLTLAPDTFTAGTDHPLTVTEGSKRRFASPRRRG